MKKATRVLSLTMAAAMAAGVLGGCSSSAQGGTASTADTSSAASTTASSADSGNVIRVGVVCSMTGGSAIYGEGAQNAVDMAVEEINSGDSGYTVEIVNGGKVADDAKDAKQAMNAYNKVMADSPVAIVGSFFSSVTLPMATQAANDGMLLLATGATNVDVTQKGSTIFRNCFIDPYQGKMAALFVKSKGFSKVAVIYAKDDDYSNGLKDAFVENCEANGIEITYTGDSGYTVEIVNGGKVADDAKDAKQAMNAYNKVMADSPVAIVGSFFSSVTLPMATQAANDGMLLLATGATNVDVTQKGSTIFRNCFIDPYQGKMAALFVKSKGFSKVAVIYAKDDDYSNGLKDAFVENCEANGIEITYTGECMSTDTDFSSQAAQAVASGAEFLYYPCFLDTVPLFVGAARNAGFTGTIMGGDAWDGADTTGLEDKFDDCYFTNHYSSEDTAPAVQNFVQKYTEKYGTESLNACAALYYDAIYMLLQAAENGGGTDTASLVKGMTGMEFTGVGGKIKLDENGDAIKSIAFNTFVDGKVKWSETLDSDGNLVSSAE